MTLELILEGRDVVDLSARFLGMIREIEVSIMLCVRGATKKCLIGFIGKVLFFEMVLAKEMIVTKNGKGFALLFCGLTSIPST